MARRPAHTLLFLAADRTARLDLGPAPALEVVDRREIPGSAAEDPAARVGRALELGGPCGRQVWLLWERAWTQTVEMPTAAVSGLPAEQLTRALAFEVEPLSAIPAADSALDSVAQGNGAAGRQAYWIVQVSGGVRDAIGQIVERAGGRLAGIAHPGGLPRSGWNGRNPIGAWRRVEVWEQAVFCLEGRPDGSADVKVVNARPGNVNWRVELGGPSESGAQWMGSTAPPEMLSDDGLPMTWTVVDLPAGDVPAAWMRAWAAELAAKPRRVPMVVPQAVGSPARTTAWIGAAAAAAVLLACGLHAHSLISRTDAARTNADAEQAKRERLAGGPAARKALEQKDRDLKAALVEVKKTTDAAEKELAGFAERRDEAVRGLADEKARRAALESARADQRRRLPALLAALHEAEADEGDVLVLEVKPHEAGWLLTGICAKPGCADDFTAALAAKLEKCGWRIQPAQTKLRADGGAWDFSIRLAVELPRVGAAADARPDPKKAGGGS